MSIESLGRGSIEMVPSNEEKNPPNPTDSDFESVSTAERSKSELSNDLAKQLLVQTDDKEACADDDTKPATPEKNQDKPTINNSDCLKSPVGLQLSKEQCSPSHRQLLKSGRDKKIERQFKISLQRHLRSLTPRRRHQQSSKRLQLAKKSADTCESTVSCIMCNEKCLNQLELRKHAAIEHPDVSFIFCDLCNASFINENDLSSHKSSIHVKLTRKEILKRRRKMRIMKSFSHFSGGTQIKFYLRSFMQSSIQRKQLIRAQRRILQRRHLRERITPKKPMELNSSSPKHENLIDDSLNQFSGLENNALICPNTPTAELIQIEQYSDEQTNDPPPESCLMPRETVLCESISDLGDLSDIYTEDSSASCKIKAENDEQSTDEPQNTVTDQSTEKIAELESQIMTLDENPSDKSTKSSPSHLTASKSCKTYEVKLSTRAGSFIESDFCIMCSQIFDIIEKKNPKLSSQSLLRCPLCSIQVTSIYLLKKHIANVHLNCDCTKPTQMTDAKVFDSSTPDLFVCKPMVHPVYPCAHCAKIFVSYNKLASHILTFHELKPPLREKSTANQPEYLRILKNSVVQSRSSRRPGATSIRHASVNYCSMITCAYCPRRFTKCRHYIHHIKEQHQDFTVKYSVDNSSITLDNIVESPQDVAQQSENIFMDMDPQALSGIGRKTCKKCLKVFRSMKEMSNHYYSVHDDKHDSAGSEEKYKKCKQCPHTFKIMQSYIRHKYLMHNDDSMVHICENCCKILTSVPMVNTHICVNAYSWSCGPCNATFPSSMALRLHRNIYHVETVGPHICTLCQKSFLTHSMLVRHLDTHEFITISTDSIEESDSTLIADECPEEVTATAKTPVKIEHAEESMENYQVSPPPSPHEFETGIISVKTEPKAEENQPNLSSSTQETGAVYRCTLCRLDFAEKAVLDIHLNRAHTSAVEICQLCYQMVFTGALVRHIIDNHIPRDSKTPLFHTMKQEDLLGNDSQTIEKDTEELIRKIGKHQLLGLCEYNKYTDQTHFDEVFCADCLVKIDNCVEFRRHNVQVHDKMCALCNMQFETGEEAAAHKTSAHGSIACYVWFAQKVVAAIEDTQTFTHTANEMINEATQGNGFFFTDQVENPVDSESVFLEDTRDIDPDDPGDHYEDQMQCNQMDESINELAEEQIEDSIEYGMENEMEEIQSPQDCVLHVEEEYASTEDSDETPEILLIVTESDLERYRYDIPGLALEIGLNHNITIGNEVIEMLQSYVTTYLEE